MENNKDLGGAAVRGEVVAHPAWKRTILYTDTIGGNNAMRDDLWAITTTELKALLSARAADALDSRKAAACADPEEPSEREALIACLGDDAATLSAANPDDEMAQTMREAAAMLEANGKALDSQPTDRPTDDALWDATLRQRDYYHDQADDLAAAIASYLGADIGEHSSGNCPWANAIEALDEADPYERDGAPVAPIAPDGWISADERLPEVRMNDYDEFIVLCKRNNGEKYVFSAYYLNNKLLQSRWPDEDEPEEGLPLSGWHFESEVDGDNVFSQVCEPGDVVTHWQPLPSAPQQEGSEAGNG